ncbi:MAG: DNA polymerase III subunit beta [Candidatus Dasytiphilus stammeri]
MKFIIQCHQIIKPLQQVCSMLSNRPALPILNNLLIKVSQDILSITGTNIEMEMINNLVLTDLHEHEDGIITVPAKKFLEICRGIPEKASITVLLNDKTILICSDKSKFSLSTLPANNFPKIEYLNSQLEFSVSHKNFKYLIEATYFSMALQDTRYYLNGMLFETEGNILRTVTTDGYRLSICTITIDKRVDNYSIIIPRKVIITILRLLDRTDNILQLKINYKYIRIHVKSMILTSKLLSGSFPNYRKVLLQNYDKSLIVECEMLKQALSRVAILSHERLHYVNFYIKLNQLKITAKNLAHEQAEETLVVSYIGDDLQISFNVYYILDVLNVLKCEKIIIWLNDTLSCIKIEAFTSQSASYLIMSIRL